MTSTQIRQSFLDFFKSKQHTIVPSSSLMPDSPNLLFTNAGMNQFVPIFLGQTQCPYSPGRAADTQKCIRAGGKHNDLDDVGLDTYHHTFFEMLGNWSFGNYFKAEAISWAWELIVETWKFPPERLYATVYNPDKSKQDPSEFDQEAWNFWAGKFRGVGLDPAVHIVNGNKKDNFWMMGETGPCGPCSELHVDLTPDGQTGGKLVNKGDSRCIEIWNLVFIQFNANPDGTFSPLPAKHVDTGMGFERVTSIIQGTHGLKDFANARISNYETDIFRPIFDALERLSGKKYGSTLPTPGSTGDSPVPVGDPPTGTERGSATQSDVVLPNGTSRHSAGLVAQRDGQVARATQPTRGASYSKRNLPHFEKPWAIYHIIINTITPRKLSSPARDVVFDCILHWRESRYRLVAACVMPEHAHFIIQPGVKEEDKEGSPVFWPLSEIIHSIKSYSAKEINKLDGCTGTLWQEERYDRYMRGDGDLAEKFHYVCRNPWAAGLVRENEPWPWLWTPEMEASEPYIPLSKRTGSTGDPPVPFGDPPTGTERGSATTKGGTGNLPFPLGDPPGEKGSDSSLPTNSQIQIDIAFRVIADHIRTLSFAIADGIQPGNNDRNYVLRRILRRAVRYGRTLGFKEPFFYKLVDVLADTMGDVFPEIRVRKKQVQETIRIEEEAFNKTLDNGIEIFNARVEFAKELYKQAQEIANLHCDLNKSYPKGLPEKPDEVFFAVVKGHRVNWRHIAEGWDKLVATIEEAQFVLARENVRKLSDNLRESSELEFGALTNLFDLRSKLIWQNVIPGEVAFRLYDTYGFPLDLTELMARERGLTVDTEGFERLMEEQRARARAAQKKEVISLSQIETTAPTKFVGYEDLTVQAKVLEVVSLKDKTAVVLDASACYAEMGGQVGDTGELTGNGQLWRINNTQKSGNTWLHFIEGGETPVVGSGVTLSVEKSRRLAIERHHTVTHLLHWALHEVASKEASQKGSFVGPDKLTFDFNSAPLTPQQIVDIEKLVNERILDNAPVSWTEVAHAQVKNRKDVMQFFGDKYGDTVRVVQIGGKPAALDGYSMELCGGTHTRATGEIGLFRIVGENAIAAGVRRIEAVAGLEAYGLAHAQLQLIRSLAGKINSPVHELEKKVDLLLAQQKDLEKSLKSAIQRNAAQTASWLVTRAHEVNAIPLITQIFPDSNADYLQAVTDALKGRFKGVVVVGGSEAGSVALVASVSPEFTTKVQAGKLIQQIAPIVGGKGGGKPDNARGGGKDPARLDEALAQVKSLLA